MSEIGVADAARNNAAWCDAMCSAHGRPGAFFDSHWINRAPVPPLHPNLVTLAPAVEPTMAAVRELAEARPAASWAVKDSFAVLPLEQAGFRVLFEAEWIARPARRGGMGRRSLGGHLFRVHSEPALAEWEAAWGESPEQPRLFLPDLLRRSEVAILATRGGGDAIRAGAIVNHSGNAVGLSNFFARGEQRAALRAACVDAAADTFPGLPLVGYEAGQDLAECLALGFSPLGALRVWTSGVASNMTDGDRR